MVWPKLALLFTDPLVPSSSPRSWVLSVWWGGSWIRDPWSQWKWDPRCLSQERVGSGGTGSNKVGPATARHCFLSTQRTGKLLPHSWDWEPLTCHPYIDRGAPGPPEVPPWTLLEGLERWRVKTFHSICTGSNSLCYRGKDLLSVGKEMDRIERQQIHCHKL